MMPGTDRDGNSSEDQERDKRCYNYMSNILTHIVSKISVNEEDKRRHNQILDSAIEIMLTKMRGTSKLFAKLYTRTFFGGSFYDNLKTGKPDEYDIDLLMVLAKTQIFSLKPIQDAPGFATLQLTDKTDITKFAELLDGDFLCTDKVLRWMESIVSKTLTNLPQSGNQSILRIQETDFFITISKSGPAFTIKLNGEFNGDHMNFNIDLVPCFLFNARMWPTGKFRSNPVKDKTDFFIVPKQPKGKLNCKMSHCWRLSFQEQERQIIRGAYTLKPCIKLMKKLRDELQHCSISSYFIKTMFMWQIDREGKEFFTDNSLSYVFVKMLQIYGNYLSDHSIPYYWNTDNNLIGALSPIMLDNYKNRVRKIVSDIHNKASSNPLFIAKFYLSKEEMEQFKAVVQVPVSAETSSTLIDSENSFITSPASNSIMENVNFENSNGTQCKCAQMDAMLCELRKEMTDARREQDALKIEILDLLQVVVKRLDKIDDKFPQN